MTIKTTLATATAVLLATLVLTGCSPAETQPSPTTPAPTAPSVIETPEPAETDKPVAEEFDGVVVEDKNADGTFTLPDGTTVDCGDEAKGVFVDDEGTWSCDTGVDW